jgi:lipoprotein-releasing system ATP-binding protein
MMTQDALLAAKGVHKSFSMPGGGELEILRGVDFSIRKGEIAFILGRSGAGKSTLLHVLASLDRPSSGAVTFRGKDLARMNERALADYRNRKLGFIFQFYYLLPELTLLENVMLPVWIGRKGAGKKKALPLLERMGLQDRASHYPTQLSGGEQQRAAIARALINSPDLVFCDEPTGNLDEETAEQVFDLILRLNREDGQTFLIVTHEESLIRKARRVYHLHEGRLSLKES